MSILLKSTQRTIFCFLIFFGFGTLVHAQVFSVPNKDETPTKTLFIPAKAPKAIVLLFPGGGGMLRLTDEGATKNPHTFVRSKDMWSQYGIHAVLVDSPYDLGITRNSLRGTSDHMDRVAQVVAFYKQKYDLPLWIFGHSMGSATVTNFSNKHKTQKAIVDGIIVAGTNATAKLDEDVLFPTLAIHHRYDSCKHDPLSNSEKLINSRDSSIRKKLVILEGGSNDGDECQSLSYHGFYKIEEQFISEAANFILRTKSD